MEHLTLENMCKNTIIFTEKWMERQSEDKLYIKDNVFFSELKKQLSQRFQYFKIKELKSKYLRVEKNEKRKITFAKFYAQEESDLIKNINNTLNQVLLSRKTESENLISLNNIVNFKF